MLGLDPDDRDLLYAWSQLDPKTRYKVLRSSTRKAANKVKRAAQSVLRSSGINNAADIAKQIRVANFQKMLGFKVKVMNKGKKNMHTNRFGKQKPLAFWFAGGTAERATKTRGRRGMLTKQGFMAAAQEANKSAVEEVEKNLAEMIDKLTKH